MVDLVQLHEVFPQDFLEPQGLLLKWGLHLGLMRDLILVLDVLVHLAFLEHRISAVAFEVYCSWASPAVWANSGTWAWPVHRVLLHHHVHSAPP